MIEIKALKESELDQIMPIFKHPEIHPFIVDDFTKDFYDLKIISKWGIFLLIKNGEENIGFILIVPWNGICFEGHIAILPKYRGEKSIESIRKGCEWLYSNTSCQKIIAQIPVYNQKAYAAILSAGAKLEGINEKSIMRNGKLHDQYLLGFKKEN